VLELSFSYNNFSPVLIKKKTDLKIYEPKDIKIKGTERDIIQKGFCQPINSYSLSELAQKAKNALIVVDDCTRTTPVKRFFSLILSELKKGGLSHKDIQIIIGLGKHRPMTKNELYEKLGNFSSQLSVINYDPYDEENFIYYGTTASGIPIKIHKAVKNFELLIGIGQIAPHNIAGFSGGAKIICPGICGLETIDQTHWLSAAYSSSSLLGNPNNPIRKEIENISQKVGLNVIINIVQNPNNGKIVALVFGDPVTAHRQGCKIARQVFEVEVRKPADIVVVESYPADNELYQAVKALYGASLLLNKNGIIILVTPAYEGISSQPRISEYILKYGYQTYPQIRKLVNKESIDLHIASHLARVGNIIKHTKTFLVSPSIEKEKAQKIGFIPADNANEAIRKSYKLLKLKSPRIAFIRKGGKFLPIKSY